MAHRNRRNRHTWRRWAAAVAACAAAVLGGTSAVPAQAEPAGGQSLHLVVDQRVGLPQPADRQDPPQISWSLVAPDGSTVKDVDVSLDVSGITSFADAGSPCQGGTCVWHRGDIGASGTGGLVELNAKPGVPPGTTGTAVLTGTASNATIDRVEITVTVGVVGLVVGPVPPTGHAVPGSTLDAPFTVADTGQLGADGVDLEVTTTTGLDFAQRFANCDYRTVSDPDIPTLTDDAVCHLATAVAPGRKYRLSAPFGIGVTHQALWERVRYHAAPADAPAPAPHGTGPVLSLVPDGAAPTSGSDSADWTVDADNTADLAAGGDSAHGSPGDRVVLTAELRDLGPASVDVETTDNQLGVMVDIPPGTTAVRVPPRCNPWAVDGPGQPALGAPKYICEVARPFTDGELLRLPFTVRIDAGAPAVTTGRVRATTVYDLGLPFDHHHGNDSATLTVDVAGGAVASSGGGTGGAGPTTPAAAGAHSATGGSGAGGQADDSAPDGTLAATGGDGAMTIGWIGAAALAFGAAVLAVFHSRRARA